ncbi:cadherin-23-like [Chelonus insularis]|uniref:cadherin-23-like n=1 Tax=Chelonus insularis TaxID=460826 RepID=UPI00158ECD89|nr:cadherin-23-like [Chelonus insularis]
MILEVYEEGGIKGMSMLSGKDENGRIAVTKNANCLQTIANYLKTKVRNNYIHPPGAAKLFPGYELKKYASSLLLFAAPNNNISYLLNSNYPAPLEYFYLDKYSGLLQVSLIGGRILDRDFVAESYTLNLRIRDNYIYNNTWNSNAIDTVITVVLDDINDQIPKLQEVTNPIIVNEYTNQSISVTNITMDDRDDPKTNNTKAIFKILNMTLLNQGSESNRIKSYILCRDPFKVITINYKYANILTNRPLFGCYGTWALELYAQDLGTYPGSLNDTKIYYIYVSDYNYNAPKITYPVNKQKIALSINQTLLTTLKAYDGQPLKDFTAQDSDNGESGIVTFQISSYSNDHQFFKIVSTNLNSAQLQLTKLPIITESNTYQINLTATDHGTPSRNIFHEFSVIFVSVRGPAFYKNEWCIWIKENTTTLDEKIKIPEAHDNIEDSHTIPIYYFIDDKVGDNEYFQLHKDSRELSLKKKLDREEKDVLTIQVIATASSFGPPRDPEKEAILNITIIVVDINDNPPIFQSKFYSAGVATGDVIDNIILTVKAIDADLNETLKYYIKYESMNISDPSLAEAAARNPFILDSNSGDLLLKFSPSTVMAGYFSFTIIVYDTDLQNADTSLIQVYIVSQDNRVEFTFRNSPSYVSEQKLFIIDIFYTAFKYRCNIDKIRGISTARNSLKNETIITSHFIDAKNHLPITADVIVLACGNLQTLTNLKALLQSKSLYLIDVPTGSSSVVDDTEQTVLWILLTFTIFFAICTIALAVAYVTRVRSLLRRLNGVAAGIELDKKSDDTKILPTTNHFALSGSNPIWKSSKPVIDVRDNISQISGNSDLIGIETDSNFNYNHNNINPFQESIRNTEKINKSFIEWPKLILEDSSVSEYPEEDIKC